MATEPVESSAPSSALLLFATLTFALSVRGGASVGLAAIAGTAALALSHIGREGKLSHLDGGRKDRLLAMAVIGLGGLGALGWAPSSFGPTSSVLETLPGIGWAVLALVVYAMRHRASESLLRAGLVSALFLTAVVGVAHLSAARGVGIDVYFLHNAAADAISEGVSPYSDAVRVPNGSPGAGPDDMITGYVYPPITAFAYSAGRWLFNDPRVVSLIAWLAILGIVGSRAIRSSRSSGLLGTLVLAAIPGWALVLRAAWTEPFTLLLLTLAFLAWKSPRSSGLTLGLGLASKQYFAVTAPSLLFHRDQHSKKRALLAVTAIGATLAVGVLWGPLDFWRSAVEFHLTTPTRFDSVNLLGVLSDLGVRWHPPAGLAVIVGLVVSILASRKSESASSYISALALTLAASFLVATQAFANYWFLIAGLVGLLLVESLHSRQPSSALEQAATS